MFSYKKSLKKPKGGNQNPYIEEEQTTQWPKKKYKRTNNNLQTYTAAHSFIWEGWYFTHMWKVLA